MENRKEITKLIRLVKIDGKRIKSVRPFNSLFMNKNLERFNDELYSDIADKIYVN